MKNYGFLFFLLVTLASGFISQPQQRFPASIRYLFPEVIPDAVEVFLGLGLGFAGWLYVDGADDRARRKVREKENEQYLLVCPLLHTMCLGCSRIFSYICVLLINSIKGL